MKVTPINQRYFLTYPVFYTLRHNHVTLATCNKNENANDCFEYNGVFVRLENWLGGENIRSGSRDIIVVVFRHCFSNEATLAGRHG